MVVDAVPRDAKVPIWFQKAADQGYMYAQAELGLIYENGWGVPQDYVRAHMWFNLAASHAASDNFYFEANRDRVIKLRDDVASKLTPAQIAGAQPMAREWKPEVTMQRWSVDPDQYAQAAMCKHGNVRVVTRTKSLHRRRTRSL